MAAGAGDLLETNSSRRIWILSALVAGTAVRLYLAKLTFLDPDEGLHYFVSAQPTLPAAYAASLTTAHPPLMILLLYLWSKLGHSEFFLRLPFVIAGVLFCWLTFLWVRKIASGTAAWFSLLLCLFLPPLISLSAEIRQYSLLLFFCAACLYSLERSFDAKSAGWMMASAIALYLALLTHYSALIFAAGAGLYTLLRCREGLANKTFVLTWIVGQAVALAICVALFETQIAPLHRAGVPSEIASTWLGRSIFHPGQDHLLTFAASKTVRLFRYLFSHGTIGVLALLLFLFGVFRLLRSKNSASSRDRSLALLLLSPFLLTLGAAVVGLYPYGGTRHDVILVVFATPAMAIELDRLRIPKFEVNWKYKALLVLVGLAVCNAFPSATGPTIRSENQNRRLMSQATAFLESQPGATLLTDYQSGLVLNFYLCRDNSQLPFGKTTEQLFGWRCADHRVLTSLRTQQGMQLSELSPVLKQAWSDAADAKTVWIFQTGWIEDEKQEWVSALREAGCAGVWNFGPNIRICKITRIGEVR